jgi:hypothetical protein
MDKVLEAEEKLMLRLQEERELASKRARRISFTFNNTFLALILVLNAFNIKLLIESHSWPKDFMGLTVTLMLLIQHIANTRFRLGTRGYRIMQWISISYTILGCIFVALIFFKKI